MLLNHLNNVKKLNKTQMTGMTWYATFQLPDGKMMAGSHGPWLREVDEILKTYTWKAEQGPVRRNQMVFVVWKNS